MINKQLIDDIKNKKRIIIPIEDVHIQHSLKLSNFQKESAKNLFTSYINATTEAANKFNLEKFLEKYFTYELTYQNMILTFLHQKIGKELTDEIIYGENRRIVNVINDFRELIII